MNLNSPIDLFDKRALLFLPASNPRAISPLFHHGLRPMMNVKVRVGPEVYDFATNSLAMVDARPREMADQAGGEMIFNPSGETQVRAGDMLIGIGRAEAMLELTAQARGTRK